MRFTLKSNRGHHHLVKLLFFFSLTFYEWNCNIYVTEVFVMLKKMQFCYLLTSIYALRMKLWKFIDYILLVLQYFYKLQYGKCFIFIYFFGRNFKFPFSHVVYDLFGDISYKFISARYLEAINKFPIPSTFQFLLIIRNKYLHNRLFILSKPTIYVKGFFFNFKIALCYNEMHQASSIIINMLYVDKRD